MEFFFWLQEYECRNPAFLESAGSIQEIHEKLVRENTRYEDVYGELVERVKQHNTSYYALYTRKPAPPHHLCEGIGSGRVLYPSASHKFPLTPIYVDVFDLAEEEGSPGRFDIRIDLSGDIDVIMEQVRTAVETKKLAGNEQLFAYEYIMAMTQQENIRYQRGQGGFNPSSKNVRAAGLWLWDRVQELGNVPGSPAQAIREFCASEDVLLIDMENATDSDLRFYLRRTAECIMKPGVLSFSKKGTRRLPRVPGTRKRE